jgi:hypothetical protein
MGLCFNNEMYFQMSKGLIHPDILEMISNLNVVAGGIMVAPTMYIKQIWDQDPDFKFYYNQIISGLHDSLVSESLESKNQELKTFYDSNGINYQNHTKMQKESIKKWGIKEIQILDEMDRQEMEESADVTMLFAMKWFNSDLTNKGMNSDLVKGLLLSTAELKE